ncbi:unnamed protein product [Spirodela intermedia]|uniref:Protein kinase domain-containing protein n=1 Tax=Spirodela intermedia TaxID=51605 RepID=A0A7I8JRN6_SPIIN|nr:unnamed protein product [Spirodela intermedia]CAA6672838.1 unnamed protein product [Spirodela intermedia]
MATMLLLALLLGLLAVAAFAQIPSTSGFISIDCGLDDDSGYKDQVTQILYSPDEPYTSAGVNRKVSPSTNLTSIMRYYANVRSFPDGTRNCYTLRPLVRGAKYRVNAEFLYGNYDGLGRPPTFDLYLGVNLWMTMEAGDFNRSEIIAIAATESMQVCLLDLRPLLYSMYTQVDSSHSIVMLDGRKNYGGEAQITYPDDPYDRRGSPDGGVPLGEFEHHSSGSPDVPTYLAMHFAELLRLGANETREFNIYVGDSLFFGPYRPKLLLADFVYTLPPGQKGGRPTPFGPRPTPLCPHNQCPRGVHLEAISKLKDLYKVKRNWDGDPCVPQNFTWEGLECSANASNYWRITSLNLSHSGLGGGIPPFIANLTSLTSLDLSYNNFSGEIPAYVEKLQALKILNLESNNLNGTIPRTLSERSRDGSLLLRLKKGRQSPKEYPRKLWNRLLRPFKDETQVAVKVLSISSTQGTQHFRAESSYNNQLHTGGSAHHNTLSWRGRLRIALEAAQGLDYLHCGCKPPIVHRDVKPSNILLNENFEVKLADFGLSRAFTNEEATHISTLIAGTPGYLDPEYFRTNRLNEKTDVYSFGIVLLELVTGKPPIGNDSQRTHITRHVQSRLERGDIADIADQRMQGYYDVNSIWKVLEIAMSCTSRNSGERPTISTVVIQLKDCLAAESSGDSANDSSTDTLAVVPPHSMARISPSAR